MTTIVITGANRGIGLEFTKQYASDGAKVYALCRSPEEAEELKAVAGDVHIRQLDVTSEDCRKRFADEIGDETIDILINNAGIYGGDNQSLGNLDFDKWHNTMEVNVFGPVYMTTALYSNLKKSANPKVATISSKMGSIGDSSGGMAIYRTSKAAINMAMNSLSADASNDNVIMINLHPGWVQTDMGGSNAPTTPQESVTGLRKVIAEASMKDTGHFYDFKGQELPW